MITNLKLGGKFKKAYLLFLLLSVILTLNSCNTNSTESEVDILNLANRLKSEIDYKDELYEIDDTTISSKYNIDLDTVSEKIVYMSTGATAEEIAVIKANNVDSANEIYAALEGRIEFQKEDFLDYNSDEIAKLNAPVLEQKGALIILCVSDESEIATQIIGEEL